FLFLVLFLYKFCPQFVPLHINNREKHTKYQYITNQFIFSASASDGLESAITNYNHSEQSRCISATFLF
ncbi:MAG: hypothetical protein KAY25_09805, partial [Bacteroides sp.]|nr:hypothetical protein [Bacteroides sp.]